MKTSTKLQSILAGVGAGSLLIYVLACSTSFSPDDRQVLYPSFDAKNGATAVALYDRKTGRSEIVFLTAEAEDATNPAPVPLRAEWLPDGKHILVARAEKHDGLDLFVLPRGVNEPVRHFSVAGIHDATVSVEFPFAITGRQLFLNTDHNSWLRVDLTTGETVSGDTNQGHLFILPSLDGKSLTAVLDGENGKSTKFGSFDPQTGQFKLLGQLGTNVGEGTVPAFNPADGRVMNISKVDGQIVLQISKDGKSEFTRPLAHGDDSLQPGPFLELSSDGKTVLTAYCAKSEATTNSEYGLLEIPLSDAPLRFTPLFHATHSDNADLIFAQSSLSHDGRTWALGTALLWQQNESLKPEDCALFLVDLGKSKRPVTKIPIPVPSERKSFK